MIQFLPKTSYFSHPQVFLVTGEPLLFPSHNLTQAGMKKEEDRGQKREFIVFTWNTYTLQNKCHSAINNSR